MAWVVLQAVAVLSIPILWLVVLTRHDPTLELQERLRRLERRVAALDAAAADPQAPSAPAPPPAALAATPAPSAAEVPEAESAMAPAAGPAEPRPSIEEWIMRRWAVWLGALALALGGVFLVKYSIEQGYFGPSARIVAGVVLGLALVGTSEIAHRHPLVAAGLDAATPDYLPPALAAAGIAVLFASIYAGYAVYDLIAATAAFFLLAGISLCGAALSLRHGMVLAVLGFVGAYVVPLLVASESPSVSALLSYVFAVSGGCLLLVRWRAWPWLGWSAIGGSGFWTAMALFYGGPGDEVWIGLFLVLSASLFPAALGEAGATRHRAALMWSGTGMAAALMLALALTAQTDGTSLCFVWALTALYAGIGGRWARFDRLPWMAALLQVLVLAGWEFAGGVTGRERLERLLLLPPSTALGSYLATAGLVAALAGFGGFLMVTRAAPPQRWAALSAATPLAVLAVVYWRVEQLAVNLPWAAASFLLGGAFLGAVDYVAERRARPGFTSALAYYALAVTGAVALALTLSLRLGWLSVALALELPAIAWLWRRTGVLVLRRAALVLGAVVLVRLLLNPAVADYALGNRPIINALLYLYGVPAAAFALTARWLRRGADDAVVQLLEAGAVALGLALASLEIRHFVGGGRIDNTHYGLFEQALQTDTWLAFAYWLMPRSGEAARPMRAWAWRVILAVAAAHFALLPCLLDNPLWSGSRVGGLPLLDVLLIAYAVPAGFGVLFHHRLRALGLGGWARAAAIAAVTLAFVYITLEIRHLFHGARLAWGAVTDGESYAYSAAWLAYGAALLAWGILRSDGRLRIAGLVIGALVAVKAFGFDMSNLTGLYRVASFLGLGASLMAIAWLYQRMVRPGPPRLTS